MRRSNVAVIVVMVHLLFASYVAACRMIHVLTQARITKQIFKVTLISRVLSLRLDHLWCRVWPGQTDDARGVTDWCVLDNLRAAVIQPTFENAVVWGSYNAQARGTPAADQSLAALYFS